MYAYRRELEYLVWRLGGNPECIDWTRAEAAYGARLPVDDAANAEYRRQCEQRRTQLEIEIDEQPF